MGLETGTYVNDLNTANPTSTDPKSQGDDHLRLIKSVLKNTFAGFPGLVVATGTEAQGATVNDYTVTLSPSPAAYTSFFFIGFKATHNNNGAATLQVGSLGTKALVAVDGQALVNGDIKNGMTVVAWYDGAQFYLISANDRAHRGGDVYLGTHDFTGATPKVPTKTQGDNSTNAASTAYVDLSTANEAATRTANDNTLQTNINAANAARIAGDNALQTSKADLASPAFTGVPTAPTATTGTSTTQLATCAFVVATSFNAALPGQAGQATGSTVITDGAGNASWTPPASQAEMEAGTQSAIRSMSPLRVAQAISMLSKWCRATFVADNAVTQGKAVILKSNGKVANCAIAAESVGTGVNISGNNTTGINVIRDPVSGNFVVFYCDTTDSNKGKAVIATVSGSSVSFGSPFTFSTSGLYIASGNQISSCYDPNTNQIILAYSVGGIGKLCTCAISGASLSFGVELNTTFNAYDLGVCYDKSVSRVLFAHRDTAIQKAAVIAVSGTTLSIVSTGTAYGSNVNGYTSSVVHLAGYSSAGYNAICFNTGGAAYIIQALINPSTYALTFGTAYTVTDASGFGGYAFGECTLAWSEALQRLAVLYQNGPSGSYQLYCNLYSVSGTAWNRTAATLVDSSFYSAPYQNLPSLACSPDGLSLCVVYPDVGSTQYGKLKFATTFGVSSLSFGTELQFQTSDVGWTNVAYTSDSLKALVGYSITSGLGKAVVATAPLLDRRTDFIGFAQSSVAAGQSVSVALPFSLETNQSGLTPNSVYYLSASDGSTLTTTVNGPKVGKALSATSLITLGSNNY